MEYKWILTRGDNIIDVFKKKFFFDVLFVDNVDGRLTLAATEAIHCLQFFQEVVYAVGPGACSNELVIQVSSIAASLLFMNKTFSYITDGKIMFTILKIEKKHIIFSTVL